MGQILVILPGAGCPRQTLPTNAAAGRDMGKRAEKNEAVQAKGQVVEELEETTITEDVELIRKHYLKGKDSATIHLHRRRQCGQYGM